MEPLNKLVEIPVCELPALRDLFKQDWPTHMIGYFTIDNYIRWLQETPTIPNLKIFSLNGDWINDGLYLIVVS